MSHALRSCLVLLACLSGGLATAGGSIAVTDPSVRLVPPTAENTGVFMLIRNSGATEARLVSAESTAAKAVELHTVIEEGGMKKMRPVPHIAIPANGETTLKPGSYHVMLIGLVKPLNEGDIVPLTLKFDDGSSQSLQAPVRRIAMPAEKKEAMPMK